MGAAKIVSPKEFDSKRKAFLGRMRKGSVFVYPTDTVYGLGCDATNANAVSRLRGMKQSRQPFSVIAPSLKWIQENCAVSAEAKKWLANIPGPYTLILNLKLKTAVSSEVNLGKTSIGVRIPVHWFSKVVSELGFPIVTTSANISGESFMTSIEDADKGILKNVDFIIYEGSKATRPSTLIYLASGQAVIRKR